MTSGKFVNINKTNWKQMDNGELISYYKSSCFKKMLNLFLVPGSILKRTLCITEEVDNKEIEFFCSLWSQDLFTQVSKNNEVKCFKFSCWTFSLQKSVIKVRNTQKMCHLYNTKSGLASRVTRGGCTATNNYSYNNCI